MKVLVAIVGSIAIHALLAVATVAYIEYAPGPDVLATLDLSSVELSFAEDVDESRAATPLPPPPAPDPTAPKAEERPPEAKAEKPTPADPPEPTLRAPAEERPHMDAPPPPETSRPPVESQSAETPQPSVAPRQARVDAPPRPKSKIKPDYPKGARQRGEQGSVTLEIRVNEEGTVDSVKVVASCGFAELDEEAVRATKAARFTPARSGREAVASTARLKLDFKLK